MTAQTDFLTLFDELYAEETPPKEEAPPKIEPLRRVESPRNPPVRDKIPEPKPAPKTETEPVDEDGNVTTVQQIAMFKITGENSGDANSMGSRGHIPLRLQVPQKPKRTPNDYGGGMSEVDVFAVMGRPFSRLSVEKQAGVIAHYMHEQMVTRRTARAAREPVLGRGVEFDVWYEAYGKALYRSHFDEWQQEYGWVPGYWNPRPLCKPNQKDVESIVNKWIRRLQNDRTD